MNNISLHIGLLISVWAITMNRPKTKTAYYIKTYLTYSLYLSLTLAIVGDYYRNQLLPSLLKVEYSFYNAIPILKFIIQDVILVQPVIPLILLILCAQTSDKRILCFYIVVWIFLIMVYFESVQEKEIRSFEEPPVKTSSTPKRSAQQSQTQMPKKEQIKTPTYDQNQDQPDKPLTLGEVFWKIVIFIFEVIVEAS